MKKRDAYILAHINSDKEIDLETYIEARKILIRCDERLGQLLDLELRIVNLGGFAIEECQKMLHEDGISSVMSIVSIQESLMHKTTNPQHKFLIVDMLREKLSKFLPQKELIIVDNYIFPRKLNDKVEYFHMLEDVFRPAVEQIESLIFVTKKGFNQDLYSEFRNILLDLNPNLSIECNITDDFHDRFWITDRQDGLFIGTSLNGIGKRYALVDTIEEDDVEEIVKTLEKLNLI